MPFFFRSKRSTGLLFLGIFCALLLSGCGESSPTSPPTATVEPTTVASTVASTLPVDGTNPVTPTAPVAIPPTPAATTSDIDPNVAYTPGTVITTTPGGTPTPRETTPVATANYGALPTPPRTLVPQTSGSGGAPATKAGSLTPLAKGNFVVATNNGLYLLSPDGKTDYTLVAGAAFSTPKISPDGTRLAVFRTDPISLKQQLYIIDSQGGAKMVTSEGGAILHYSWSPDGKTLALTRATDANDDGVVDLNDKTAIWLYDVNGAKQQQVADGQEAAWSPDGVRLAFIIPGPPPAPNDVDPSTHKLRRSPNAVGIYNVQQNAKRTLVPAKGVEFALGDVVEDANLKKSTVTLRYFKEVSWYPDSKHITVSADATGPNDLRLGVIMSLTVEEPTPHLLTAGGDAAHKLLWSPDGKKLVFETEGQYPLKPKSGEALAVLDNVNLSAASPTRLYLGDPSVRNFTKQPIWINGGGQLAYLKGDNNILSLSDADGKNEHTLISGCLGFDFY